VFLIPTEPFSYCLRVAYADTDAQGRVYYGRFFPFLDRARDEFWRSLGFSEEETIRIEHETVMVEMQVRYFNPARFYDLLRIFVEVARLGNSSVHLRFKIINDKTGQEILQATQVHVQIDPKTEKSIPWSDLFREVVIKKFKDVVQKE